MAQAKDSDALFADCAEELKALLRRGGAILFDKVVTGPAARRFLKEAGVFDPTATAEPCPVAFSENFLAFTDWYEQVEYGDSLLSWIIGMPVTKHAEKVERLRGGPGVEVVR